MTMILNPEVPTTGDHWNEEIGMYLDVPAIAQGPPFWWERDTETYNRLKTLRKEEGIEVDDRLFPHPETQDDWEEDEEDDDE